MPKKTTLRIAHDCTNVIGIKDAGGDLEQGKAVLDGRPDNFIVLSGDDENRNTPNSIGC